MNTTKKGQVRCLVFKEEDTWYGVALEFNIVVQGDDNDVVYAELQDAIRGYIESQKKIGGTRFHALNQRSDDEYESIWSKAVANKPVPSPIQLKYYGYTRV